MLVGQLINNDKSPNSHRSRGDLVCLLSAHPLISLCIAFVKAKCQLLKQLIWTSLGDRRPKKPTNIFAPRNQPCVWAYLLLGRCDWLSPLLLSASGARLRARGVFTRGIIRQQYYTI